MQGNAARFVSLVVAVCSVVSAVWADTWVLQDSGELKPALVDSNDKYLLAVAEVKKLIDAGQTDAAKKAFSSLKKDFPKDAGHDFDLFVKAELFYCRGYFSRAVVSYNKLLNKYPQSKFYEPALDREFIIGESFLAGRKKRVLVIFKMSGFSEGVKIMEGISDRSGLDDPNGLGLKAAVAVAERYEEKQKFSEAYLKWSEIASYWETGKIGKEALLKMAQNKLAAYNAAPSERRCRYDASRLTTARTYYEKFNLLYSEDAQKLGVPAIIQEIDEQLAYKEYVVGKYYQRTGSKQAANLYFDMVIHNWPNSKAAQMAKANTTAGEIK
jgi:outer membrane protein assembly factor BamD